MDKDCEDYPYCARTKRRKVKAMVDNHLREIEQNLCSLEAEVDECPDIMASMANVGELLIEQPCQEHPLSLSDSLEQATSASNVASFACSTEPDSIDLITMDSDTNININEMDDISFVDSSSYDSSSDDKHRRCEIVKSNVNIVRLLID